MRSYFVVLCTYALMANSCLGAPVLDDIFSGFLRNADLSVPPSKEKEIVKRRIYEENRDAAGLKQISLQSLIGDLEQSLFQSAISVSSVAHDKDAIVQEVTPTTAEHGINKRHTTETTSNQQEHSSQSTTQSTVDTRQILVQTTERIPEKVGVPAHILIDRISVQPHYGSLPLIPAFQVHHSKLISATFKEPAQSAATNVDTSPTQISIKQTELKTITATDGNGSGSVSGKVQNGNGNGVTENPKEKQEIPATTGAQLITSTITTTTTTTTAPALSQTNVVQPNTATSPIGTVVVPVGASTILTPVAETLTSTTTTSPSTSTSTPTTTSTTTTASSTTTSTTTSSTTPTPIKKLKEAEEELKEKVAEIEAEPVILSARV